MTTNETMSPQEVRDLQAIVPTWMEKILKQAEQKNKQVEVTRTITPFGTFTTAVEIKGEQHG